MQSYHRQLTADSNLKHLKHCWEPVVWGAVDDLNALGITHLREIPEIILNAVKSLDNVATRLHWP